MKKNILSLIIIVAVCTAANAQSVIYGGLKGSLNYSFFDKSLKSESGLEYERSGLVGYGIGYYEVLELDNKINLQAELNLNTISFAQKGKDLKEGNETIKGSTTRYTYNNMELPFMVKYRVSESFAIGAGYQFNLLNSRFRKGKQIDIDGESDEKTTIDLDREVVPSTQGFIIDASVKNNKVIGGLRILFADDPLFISEVTGRKSNVNVALYIAYTLFK